MPPCGPCGVRKSYNKSRDGSGASGRGGLRNDRRAEAGRTKRLGGVWRRLVPGVLVARVAGCPVIADLEEEIGEQGGPDDGQASPVEDPGGVGRGMHESMVAAEGAGERTCGMRVSLEQLTRWPGPASVPDATRRKRRVPGLRRGCAPGRGAVRGPRGTTTRLSACNR